MPTWTKEQSDAIYQSGSNIIVSAGAGSGKTAVLTTRVLHKLSLGIHVNELLILTFTKAAAAEMKERIRKNIKKDPNLKNELSLLDSAYVTTFDSFSLSIVKKYHYLLNVPSEIKITDDTLIELLKKDTLRDVLDEFYENEDSDFLELINEFCVKDDNEIYTSLLNISKNLEGDFTKYEKLENYNSYFLSTKKIEEYIREFEQFLLIKQSSIKEKIEELNRIAPKDYIAKIYDNLNTLLTATDLDTLVSVKSSKLPPLPRNMEEEVKNSKEELNETLKELLKLLEYGNKETLIQDINKMKKYIDVFCRILINYFKELEKRKTERKYYDFNDIARLALDLLRQNTEVKEEIKNSFKEIMIDEYQDTNNIQEEFIGLISNNNVYMVGDIKQSIYRFRNANPYLFKNKYDAYRNHQGGEKIDLLKNFRSRKEVLQNINQIFNLIMDDFLGGANYIEEHQMIFGNNNYIESGTTKENYHMDLMIYPYQKDCGFTKEEIEIFTIGTDIKKKIEEGYLLYDKDSGEIHKASFKDFVILMDRSTSFELYKKIFNYLKIPLDLYKDETFSDSTCFYVIKNIIQVIVSYSNKRFDSNFRFAFTSIARSFLFEYNDQEIYNILMNFNWYNNTIYETIKSVLDNMNTKSISKILNEIFVATNIYEKILKIGDIKENVTILNHIKSLADNYQDEGKNIEEFSDFLSRINKEEMQIKYSNYEQNEECVKIMTIHKSKGLEYPICYFSGLYKSFNISDVKERFVYDKKYGIITPLKDEGLYSSFLKELMKQNYLVEEISEKIRLFYVAATRAKEKMIFVLPKKEKNNVPLTLENRLKNRSLADFLYNIWNNLKEYQMEIDLNKIHLSKDYLIINSEEIRLNDCTEKITVKELTSSKKKIEQQKFSKNNTVLNTKEDDQNIKLGVKMHEYLELIDFQNPNYNLIPEIFLRKKIKDFLETPFMKKNKTAEIYKEFEFIYEEDNQEYHGMIDLMLIDKDKIILVDYKLNNIVDQAYEKQLKGYQSYIERKSKKRVEIYLYSILNEQIINIEENTIMV